MSKARDKPQKRLSCFQAEPIAFTRRFRQLSRIRECGSTFAQVDMAPLFMQNLRLMTNRRASNKLLQFLGCLSFAVIFHVSVSAQTMPSDVLIEEFFISERVNVEPKGETQVTFAFDYRKPNTYYAPLIVEYGITDRLQVEAQLPIKSRVSAASPSNVGADRGDFSFGLLYAFAPSIRKGALTAGVEIEIPKDKENIAGEVEREGVRVAPTVIFGKQIGKGQIQTGASFAFGKRHEFSYGLAGVYPWRRWRGTLEFNGSIESEQQPFFITPGAIRKFGEHLELGVAVPFGVSGRAPRSGFIFKITAEL